jgi:hypothetical protein
MILGAEEQFQVGQPEPGADNFLLSSTAANPELQVMFEDDGTTGYLYAVRDAAEAEILDALHIYNVADVADRDEPVTAQIFWDEPQTTAVLIIGGYCHALYDFARQRGFCRNAFPPAKNGQPGSRELTDELVEKYFAA